jgi:hypothetical protein
VIHGLTEYHRTGLKMRRFSFIPVCQTLAAAQYFINGRSIFRAGPPLTKGYAIMNILKNLLPVGLLFIALLSLPFAGRAQFVINTNEDGTLSITGYTGTGGNVVIPDNINGRRVTMIGDSAFDSNTNLTKVTLGTNIISLGDFAFAYIYSLTDISLDTNLTDIGEYAFSGSSLTSLTLPNSVTNIGENAFSGSFNLTTVTIPS